MPKTIGFYGGKFSPLHLGHVRTMLEASTQVDELHVAVVADEAGEQSSLYSDGQSKVPFFPVSVRVRWWRELTKNLPHVHIHGVPLSGGSDDEWAEGAKGVWDAIGEPIHKVFSSEPSYGEFFKIHYPEAEHVLVDPERTRVPVSSTAIRSEGISRWWEYLPEPVRRDLTLTVVILGTESCGKSVMTSQLAAYYNTVSVEEYGRTYMGVVGDTQTRPEDYPVIAAQHFLDVQEAKNHANRVLFVDTEAWVTQNFSRMYEGQEDPVVQAFAETQKYDLYLYLEQDIPWVDDGTRVFGSQSARRDAERGLKGYLEKAGIPVVSVSGDYRQRLQQCIKAVDALIQRH